MKNLTNKRLMVVAFAGLLSLGLFVSNASAAVLDEPKSGGKFFQSKGTKSEEAYQEQGRAGAPVYEYGKGLKIGPALLKPSVQYNSTWDGNIFLEENARKSDYINYFEAGVDAELPLQGGQHLLTAGYEHDFEWFNRFPDQDHNDYHINGALQLNYVPFTLNVDHLFSHTVDRADTEFTNRVGRIENTSHGLLEIPFARFFLESEAFNLLVNYILPENSVFDHDDFMFYQRVGYDVGPQTQLLAEYGHKAIDYYKVTDRDGRAEQVALGLRGNLGARMVYQAWGGAQFRIYDESTRPDFNGFIARGALQYDISDKSSLILKVDRSPQESTFDGQSYYVRDRGELQWRQQVRERLFFTTRGIVNHNAYSRITVRGGDEETRRDWVHEETVGLEYLMPNELVTFFAEYKFRARESNTQPLDYDASSATAGVKARF